MADTDTSPDTSPGASPARATSETSDPTPEQVRCPTNPLRADGTRHTIDGCGSTNLEGPDHEGLYDCLDCGIWFTLAEARRG